MKEEVYFKAKKVIDSCDSVSQVVQCRRYVEQFYKVFNDEQLYKRLINRWQKSSVSCQCLSCRCLLLSVK